LVAWRQLEKDGAQFTHVFIGDLNEEKLDACFDRLKILGAPVRKFAGAAAETVPKMVEEIPRKGTLCMAYIDPYNLEYLSFDISEQ